MVVLCSSQYRQFGSGANEVDEIRQSRQIAKLLFPITAVKPLTVQKGRYHKFELRPMSKLASNYNMIVCSVYDTLKNIKIMKNREVSTNSLVVFSN